MKTLRDDELTTIEKKTFVEEIHGYKIPKQSKYKIGDVLEDTFFKKFRVKGTKIPVTQREILRDQQSRLSIIEGIEDNCYKLRTPTLFNVWTYIPCEFIDDPKNDYVLDFSFN